MEDENDSMRMKLEINADFNKKYKMHLGDYVGMDSADNSMTNSD